LKATPVNVRAVTTFWQGMLLRRAELPLPPRGPYYWARVPLLVGQAFELAGWEPLPNGRSFETWITKLLGAPADVELVSYTDPGRGAFRYASLVGRRLDSCLFLAGAAVASPPRDAIAALIGSEITGEGRASVLCGHFRSSDTTDDTDRTVCACFAVGLRTLHGAILESRLTSVAEIGASLHAGTNCGSCIPELAAILRDARATVGNLA